MQNNEHVTLKNALVKVLKEKGLAAHQVLETDFGRGEHGFSFPIYAGDKGSSMVATVHMIQRKDGTWRKKVELATWLEELIDGVGFGDSEKVN